MNEIIEMKPQEEKLEDVDYIILCTHPHPRSKLTYKDENYPKCNSRQFYVKWNNFKSQATIFCCRCNQELTSFNLNMQTIGGGENGHNDNTSNNNNNSGDNSSNNDILGNNNFKKIN